jgi:hypothetical protein
MKITITIEDTEDGLVSVDEIREPAVGETEEAETVATAMVDAFFDLLDGIEETESE